MSAKKNASVDDSPQEEGGIVVEYVPPSPKEDGHEKSNRRFWDKLKDVTDTTALKGFTRGGGFTGTDINPTWRMERMTEVFGPIGWGWGYEVSNRRTETLKTAKKGDVQVVFVTVRCWYVPVGEEPEWPKTSGIADRRNPPLNALWTGEQDGGTEVNMAPDEVYKQAITDGFGKTSAQIGLASSIYRGKWDDSKYKEDQERFSQMESVKNYLEVLVPELESMTDTREFRALRKRASFVANQRLAHEVNFKLGNELDAMVKEHESRVVHDLWNRVREILKSDNLDALNAGIEELKVQIIAIPDERDIAELRALVATRRAELEKAQEPKKEESNQGDSSTEPEEDARVIEVQKNSEGIPMWGRFTKAIRGNISDAVASNPRPRKEELRAFYKANEHHFAAMIQEGGQTKGYAERIQADYEAALEMLED